MAAALVLAGVACVVGAADAWDPLAGGLGFAALALAVIGVVLAVGRWWGIALVLVMAPPLAALTRAPEPGLQIVVVVPLLTVAAMVLAALALGVRALAAGRGHRTPPGVGAALLGVAALAALWGVYLDRRVVDRHPGSPRLVDLAHDRYRGVRIGMRASRLPRGGRVVSGEEVTAQEGDSGPSVTPVWRELEFDGLFVGLAHGRVRAIATTDPRAQTAEGVGNGDSLAVARRRYPGIDCEGVTNGSDSTNASYPACSGRLPDGTEVYFGGDPIDDVWLASRGSLDAGGHIRLRRR